ncbi:Ankyrin repeat domain-containing protein 46 [Durusdinium trenchii]|uniref:Ankyrin repeat domain-containing protein 46 n=1 Tax=Durusdinium trenchii TaxID=1381693 RepID=A0ABP0KBZ1_9DINO
MPLDASFNLPSEAKLLPYPALQSLPTPWPRCQDIRTMHEEPAAGDSLVVVSQSWSHQMHPDPTGVKALEIIAAVKNVAVKLRAEGRLLVFCDFLSMPQPPMTPEQEPWTKEDSLAVQQVMEALPQLMFKADAVIHIIGTPGKLMMGEGEKYHTTFKEIQRSCKLRQVGMVVQVWEEFLQFDSSSTTAGDFEKLKSNWPRRPRTFDQVVKIDNRRVKSLDDLPDEWEAVGRQCSACARWAQLLSRGDAEDRVVEMIRLPFGYRIEAEPTQQGRTYFDRFISIVKVALMEENAAHEVIFANSADVKRDILNGGARLRKAAQMGADELAHELREFTADLETKSFIPVAYELGDDGRVPGYDFENRQREMVSSLMHVFLEELNIGVSLSLWRALQEQRLDDCRRLLQDKADPNIVDGKGKTCLHHVAQARNLDATKLLLEFGASLSARDHRGCTPGHAIPLFADGVTEKFLEEFVRQDQNALFETDKAGVSAIERALLWAQSAVSGEPFEPLHSKLKDIMQREDGDSMLKWPGMEDLGIRGLNMSFPEASPTSALGRVETRRLHFNGVPRTIYVMHPANTIGTGDPLLYLGFCRLMPWPLQEPALRIIANKLSRRIFCIASEAVNTELLHSDEIDTDGQAFYTDLYTLIDTLPLPYRLVLIDSTFGVGVPLLWKLQERLKHVLIINPSWIFRNTTLGVPREALLERAKFLAGLARTKDIKTMVKHMGEFAVSVSLAMAQSDASKREYQFLLNEYESGLQNASDAFWRMSAAHPVWNFKHLTPLLTNLPPWRPHHSVDIILVYGSHSPSMSVQDSTYNLQELLPGSLTACIGMSSLLWHIEGVTPVIEVARLTELMCRSSVGTESLNAMLVAQHSPTSTRSIPSKSPAAKSKPRPLLMRASGGSLQLGGMSSTA